jgi:solute carrier family 25 (mitochondrial folate transporter), member 32
MACMLAYTYSVATTTTYPLQVIKARLQQRSEFVELTAEGNIRTARRQYKGTIATIQRMWKSGGFAVFFRGCIPNAIRVVPGAAITFVVYEAVMDFCSV